MNKILVIQTAFPGDAILTLPAIQFLKENIGNSLIDVLCIPSTKSIFESSKSVNKVIVLDKKKTHKSILKTLNFVKNFDRYDKVISFHRSFRSSLISYFTGAPERIGYENSSLKFLYTQLKPYNKSKHEIERNLLIVGWNGEKKIFPELDYETINKKNVDKILSKLNSNRIIAIAPGTIWETKKYPTIYFKEIAEKLVETGFEILLIGSNADYNLCEFIKDNNDKIINLAGKFSIPESIYLFSKCKLVICNDSAPTHMAVAADTKVLTIYCSTIPDFGFFPYRNGKVVQIEELDCKPCGIHGHKKCPKNDFKCGNNLLPEIVYEEVLKLV